MKILNKNLKTDEPICHDVAINIFSHTIFGIQFAKIQLTLNIYIR